MESTKRYKATGIVLGNYWGGGKGSYKAETMLAETKEGLITKINAAIKDGSLDSGMGYESLIGAIMNVTTISSITIDKKWYTNEETEIQLFGDLTEKEQTFLENTLICFK